VCVSEAHGDGRIPGLNPDDLIRQRVSLTWAGRSVYGGDLRALVAVKSPGVRHSLGVGADARWSGILVDHSLRGNGFGALVAQRDGNVIHRTGQHMRDESSNRPAGHATSRPDVDSVSPIRRTIFLRADRCVSSEGQGMTALAAGHECRTG
jgi:hypothetical protein